MNLYWLVVLFLIGVTLLHSAHFHNLLLIAGHTKATLAFERFSLFCPFKKVNTIVIFKTWDSMSEEDRFGRQIPRYNDQSKQVIQLWFPKLLAGMSLLIVKSIFIGWYQPQLSSNCKVRHRQMNNFVYFTLIRYLTRHKLTVIWFCIDLSGRSLHQISYRVVLKLRK